MKFTLGWLKEYLETDAEVDNISACLTGLGLEVESIQNPAEELASFSVAIIKKARPHPNADRLRLCTVETSEGLVEVVCGAPNAKTGLRGIYAPLGSVIPNSGNILKKTKIRGVESCGMLVSEKELCISDEHDSIIELSNDLALGVPAAKALGLEDPVIQIAITPNRQDCLGVYGIARDLAAAGLGKLKPLSIKSIPGKYKCPVKVNLGFDETTIDACPLFIGRYIRGVKNIPSPTWMQKRLLAIGLRPISALVDITNYISIAFARPLHVFNADCISGEINVRLSKDEKFLALDGEEYELGSQVTVIADDYKPLAMGGIMGGEESGCTTETSNVFVESALFDPIRTAISGRHHQAESDARYRFERGVDPEFTLPGIEEATRMILEICGGEPSEIVTAGSMPLWKKTISLEVNKIRNLGGIDVTEDSIIKILKDLGFLIMGKGSVIQVTPPSWRSDIDGEADLVEEVVRIYGLDNVVPVSLPKPTGVNKNIITPIQRYTNIARRTLATRGLLETVTWSFTSSELSECFGGSPQSLKLVNPISSELDVMRPSVLTNLASSIKRNIDRGASNIALFEVGPSYSSDLPQGQKSCVGVVRQGDAVPRHWAGEPRAADPLDVKSDVISVLANCGVNLSSSSIESSAPSWYHPGRSGVVKQGPNVVLAAFGELHPKILQILDIGTSVVACEVFLDVIPIRKKKGSARQPLNVSNLLFVERDFAFLVEGDLAAADLIAAVSKADKLISRVILFDVFEGKGVPEGQKSLAVTVRIQPRDRTLTDEEIDTISERLIASVQKLTGGSLRT